MLLSTKWGINELNSFVMNRVWEYRTHKYTTLPYYEGCAESMWAFEYIMKVCWEDVGIWIYYEGVLKECGHYK